MDIHTNSESTPKSKSGGLSLTYTTSKHYEKHTKSKVKSQTEGEISPPHLPLFDCLSSKQLSKVKQREREREKE